MFSNTQRLAWVTLLAAFALFCAIAVGGLWLTRYVLFEWTVDLQSTMKVGRGTAGLLQSNDVTERIVRDTYELSSGDSVSVDELSQSSIVFFDPFDTERVVATITLRAGSRVQLETAERPRFFGDNPYEIHLGNVEGEIELVVAAGLERNVRIEIIDDLGEVHIDQAGDYMLYASDSQLRVTTMRGVALLVNHDRTAQLVNVGQMGIVAADNILTQQDSTLNLVENPQLSPPEGNPAGIPRPWGCSNQAAPDNPEYTPLGTFGSELFQGRDTIHIRRVADFQLFPAETSCEQPLNSLDIRDYESLRVRVRMYLVDHSVPGCGQAGTECVLMIHMRYRNALDPNIIRDWRQGFYVRPSDGLGWPNRCDTCDDAHQHVRQGVWFTFESVDLIQDLTSDQRDLRPIILESIEFYASGHAYEVYIDEVSLIAVGPGGASDDGIVGIN